MSSLLQPSAAPRGGLIPAEAPLIDAENLFRQPGPALRADRALEIKVRECLKTFEEMGTYDSALNLCRAACPGCEVGFAQVLSDGRWIVEVRYDNLLHEGEGETAAAALVDAVLHISETIEDE